MKRRHAWVAIWILLAGCGGGGGPSNRSLADLTVVPEGATEAELQTLWDETLVAYRHGHWSQAAEDLERLVLEFPPGDHRLTRANFYLGECYMGMKTPLQAVRQFRRVSDQHPNDPLAPLALLRAGDAYAELWRRPELDPTYGQTALATYQELLNRYPDSDAAQRASARISGLEEKFAVKDFKTAMFYVRLKAYDSAILYLKSVVADYPRSAVAPRALEKLVESYRKLGYDQDVEETCGYMRRFHRDAPQTRAACPAEGEGA